MQAADGQAKLVDRLDDLVNLLAQDQPWQVQHRADANTGAEVGGAGGQVAASLAEGVVEVGLQRGVELVDRHPGFVHLQSRQQGLHAQVILLIDHHAQGLVAAEHHAAAGCLGGVLPADEMAFDEQLLVQRG